MRVTRPRLRNRRLAVAASLAAVAGSVSIFAIPAAANAAPGFGVGRNNLL